MKRLDLYRHEEQVFTLFKGLLYFIVLDIIFKVMFNDPTRSVTPIDFMIRGIEFVISVLLIFKIRMSDYSDKRVSILYEPDFFSSIQFKLLAIKAFAWFMVICSVLLTISYF